MTWRRFHLVLCVLMAVACVLRLATGNIIGAIFPLIMAAVFASVAYDFPLWIRLKRALRLAKRFFLG